jgi:electron transfer flavoprotein alpha subunit
MALGTIWVHGESGAESVSTMTLELLAKARDLADEVVVFVGGAGSDVAEELGDHGASVVRATGDLGGALQGVALASAIAAGLEAGDFAAPDMFMFGTTYDGRDVAARLSVKLDAPVITNVVDLVVDGDQILGVEPVFGGAINVTTRFTSAKPGIWLVRPKSFVAGSVGGPAASVEDLEVPDLGSTAGARVVEHFVEESSGPKLDEADIVVSGGRGLGDKDAYSLIEDLASALGAAPGASRAIVDAGWVPYSYQVGQTGKVVKPAVYIAAGISGATQHLVGMKGSKNIIAINKDSEAPIFAVADLGIVGDVHQVLPKLIEAIRARA